MRLFGFCQGFCSLFLQDALKVGFSLIDFYNKVSVLREKAQSLRTVT